MNDDKKVELINKIFKISYLHQEDDIFIDYSPHIEVISIDVYKAGWKSHKTPKRYEVHLNWDKKFGENIILDLENIINKLKGDK